MDKNINTEPLFREHVIKKNKKKHSQRTHPPKGRPNPCPLKMYLKNIYILWSKMKENVKISFCKGHLDIFMIIHNIEI